MRPTVIVRARTKVLGLQVGQEKVVPSSPMVSSLIRRGLVEVVDAGAPDAGQVFGDGEGPGEAQGAPVIPSPDPGTGEAGEAAQAAQEAAEEGDQGDAPGPDPEPEAAAPAKGARKRT